MKLTKYQKARLLEHEWDVVNSDEGQNCSWIAIQPQDGEVYLPSDQQKLCTLVINDPDAVMTPFNDGQTPTVITVNEDKKYCMPAADGTSNPTFVYPVRLICSA